MKRTIVATHLELRDRGRLVSTGPARGRHAIARVEGEREVPDQPPEPWPGPNR
ncbi:MAG: hypothetical protein AB7R55_01120 [Gemmatimonadales bacterium]